MAIKTFADFELIESPRSSTDGSGITDYLVGYASYASDTRTETRITTENLFRNMSAIMDDGSVEANKIVYAPSTRVLLNEKLSEFRTSADFIAQYDESNQPDVTVAALKSKGARFFASNELISVKVGTGKDFATIQEALEAARKWHLEGGSVLKIVVCNDLTVDSSIILNHPYGQNIQIIGLNPETLLIVPINHNFNLFECSNGCQFGLIDSLILQGSGPSNNIWPITTAIKVTNGGSIKLGNTLQITSWYQGLVAANGGTIDATGVVVKKCKDVGFLATSGSHINATNSQSRNIDSQNNIGVQDYGYRAEAGSQILAPLSMATNNLKAGYASFTNSQISAAGASSSTNYVGFLTNSMGQIDCPNYDSSNLTSATGNLLCGYQTLNGGAITGNLNGDSSKQGPVLTSSDPGPVLQSPTSNVLINDINNQSLFEIKGLGVVDNSPSTNRLTVTNGTGKGESSDIPWSPVLGVDGKNDNMNIRILPKGTGRVVIGSQANSEIQFGSFSSASGGTVVGYINIKDKDGNTRKLAVLG